MFLRQSDVMRGLALRDAIGRSIRKSSAIFVHFYQRRRAMQRNLVKDMVTVVFMATTAAASGGAWAAEAATAKEAEAMVKKGVTFLKANGKDKSFAEISSKQGQFVDRDLYLTVYRLDGTVMAHGANEKMIGRNLLELKDIDGKEFVKERMELAKTKSNFWQDYKFTNPVTKKVEPKSMYCEPHDGVVICGGVYKK